MKRIALWLAVVFVASTAWAGMTYQFSSVTSGRTGSTMAGTASVQNGNMRIDFTSGDGVMFKNGSIVISKDGGKTIYLIDPEKKEYYEIKPDELFASMGAMMKSMGADFKMSIDHQKVDVTNQGPGEPIEGYPTTKYLVDIAYDLNLDMMGMQMTSNVHTASQMWVTDKISTDDITFIQQRGLKTGIEAFDKLVEANLSAVKGFPLKQIMKTQTTMRGRTQETTTTVTITNIKKAEVPASRFEIPAGLTKTDLPMPKMPKMPQSHR